MLRRRLKRLARVYTCQNATLLEITCHGSYTHQLLTQINNKIVFINIFNKISAIKIHKKDKIVL